MDGRKRFDYVTSGRVFFFLKTEGKNLRFNYDSDTCQLDLRTISWNGFFCEVQGECNIQLAEAHGVKLNSQNHLVSALSKSSKTRAFVHKSSGVGEFGRK